MLRHPTSLWHQDARTHDIIVLLTAAPAGPAPNPLKPCGLCSYCAGVRDCGRHPASPASCCVPPDPMPARRHSLHAVGPGCSLPPRSHNWGHGPGSTCPPPSCSRSGRSSGSHRPGCTGPQPSSARRRTRTQSSAHTPAAAGPPLPLHTLAARCVVTPPRVWARE